MRYLLILGTVFIASFSSAQIRDFTMVDTKGIERNLFTELDNDKIVIIDFFSTTCGSCQLGVPEMESIWKDVLNEGELGYVWAIEAQHRTDSAINAFFDTYGGTFPAFSVIDDDSVIVDSLGYHVPYTPYYYVITPHYKIYNTSIQEVRQLVYDILGISSINTSNQPTIYAHSEYGQLVVKNIPGRMINPRTFLYNIQGQLVAYGAETLDIENIPTGTYILKLIDNEGHTQIIKLSL